MKKIIIKSLVFLFIFLGILYCIDHYFVKNDHTFKKYSFFYKHKKNTLDAIILGNSHAGEGISPDIIKGKTGLNTFNFGVGGVTFFEAYYNLLETLKYQSPKLVIVENYLIAGQVADLKKISLDNSELKKRKYQSTLYGKQFGLTKIEEAKLSIANYNFLKTFNIFKYHENWSDLNDFSKVLYSSQKEIEYPYIDSFKNIIFMSDEIAENFKSKEYNTPFFLPENSKEYLHKIIALSKEKGFKLLFVTLPFYETYYKKRKTEIDVFHNELQHFLSNQDKSIKLLDLNKKTKLDKTNFRGVPEEKKYDYRNQHLNYKGNIKATNLISNYINDTYFITKSKSNFNTPQDIFYNYDQKSSSTKFEGNIMNISNNYISKFEGSLEEATAIEKKEINLLKFNNQFDNPGWYKNTIKVTPNSMIAPNGKRTADKIIGTKIKDGYISQSISNKTGTFKFTIWLKGTGTTELTLQENGGDYAKYATNKIKLTPDWHEYSLIATKVDNSNSIRCVIRGIKNSDILYLWGAKLTEIQSNELKSVNQFDNSEWHKNTIEVTPNSMIAPNGKRTAEKITGTGVKNGYILQNISKKTGAFKFSIWLKGTGTINLLLQENGDDYTRYGTYKIKLTPNWSQYSLMSTKEDDSNSLRCVIGNIKNSDVLFAWGAKLTEIKNSKKINDIIITKNVNKIKIAGWMHIENSYIKEKYIILKKDNEFSYISLKHQIKKNKDKSLIKKGGKNYREDAYIFETPKSILEKGEYEIFQVARSAENKFYIKQLSQRIIIQ
jgi:hypothetical protein